MLENIFVGGQPTRLSSLKNRFYTAIPFIKQDIKAALKNKGMYLLDPDSANAYSVGGAIAIAGSVRSSRSYLGYTNLSTRLFLVSVCSGISAVHLVAVRPPDVGENRAGRADTRRRIGLSGIHEPRRRRPA